MRVSTNLIYDTATKSMLQRETDSLHTQQQLSTGKRILEPADDPVGASQALGLRTDQSVGQQYATNQGAAKDSLSLAESKLGSVTDLLSAAHSLLVQANDPTLSDNDRQSIGGQLQSMLNQLVGLANSRDGQGRYLFSGYQDSTQAFSVTGSGTVVYNGDQGQRTLSVAGGRQLAISDNGQSIFEQGRSGNGVFKTVATTTNTGTGSASATSVYDPTLLTGDSYQVVFHVAGANTTYDVLDTTTSTTVSSGNAYTSGGAIRFGGMEIDVEGQPADGDTFNVTPSTGQSVFTTLSNAITALSTPASAAASRAQLATQLATSLSEMDSASNHVLSVRSGFGSSLQELDNLGAANQTEDTQLSAGISRLEDVDYAQASSDLAREQLALQAAQQSFVKVTGLSLFNFLT
jgi:flagellar hook-associated protein 3 FlgL